MKEKKKVRKKVGGIEATRPKHGNIRSLKIRLGGGGVGTWAALIHSDKG